jgi:hypothetical protein
MFLDIYSRLLINHSGRSAMHKAVPASRSSRPLPRPDRGCSRLRVAARGRSRGSGRGRGRCRGCGRGRGRGRCRRHDLGTEGAVSQIGRTDRRPVVSYLTLGCLLGPLVGATAKRKSTKTPAKRKPTKTVFLPAVPRVRLAGTRFCSEAPTCSIKLESEWIRSILILGRIRVFGPSGMEGGGVLRLLYRAGQMPVLRFAEPAGRHSSAPRP